MDERPSLADAALINPFGDGPSRIRRLFKPRNFRRWAGRTIEVLALASLFTVGSTIGLILHLDTAPSRRVTANAVNQLLEPVLRGRIVVGEIEELSMRHARIKSARILDQNGDQVIVAYGIDARVQTIRLLRSVFFEDEEIPLVFPRARIESATVTLRRDEEGIPTLAWAFLPKDLTPSVVPPRPVVVHLPQIEIDDARIDGSVGAPIAADVERLAASVYIRTDERVSVDVDETAVRVRDLIPGETSGLGSFHLRVDLTPDSNAVTDPKDRVVMWAAFSGSMRPLTGAAVAPIELSAEATLTGDILEGTVRLPRMKSESRRELFPFLPIERDVRGRLRVFGLVTAFNLEGSFEIEQPDATATVVASGSMIVKEDVRLSLALSAAALDSRTIVPAAPSLIVDGQAEVLVKLVPGEEPLVHVEASTEPTLFAGERIPRVDAVLDVVRGEIIGSVSVEDPEVFLRGSFGVKDGAARYHAHAESENLSKLPWITGLTRGKAAVWITGTFENGELDGRVRGNAVRFGLRDESLRANQVGFSGTFAGSPLRPRVKAALRADDAHALGEDLDRVSITVAGDINEPDFTLDVSDRERGELKVSGTVAPAHKRARNVAFEISRGGEAAQGSIGEAALVDGGFVVEKLDMASPLLGSLGGSLRIQDEEVIGELRGANVDLTRLGQLLGVTLPADGRANVALSVVKSPTGRKGRIDVELEDARVLIVSGVGLRLSAELDGDRVKAAGYVRLVDHATPGARIAAQSARDSGPICDGSILELRAANLVGTIDGPLLDLATWKRATGSVDIVFDAAELHCLAQRVPKFLRPVAMARGEVAGGFKLTRDPGEDYPSVEDFQVGTDGLELMAHGGELGTDALDLTVTGSLDGASGELALKGTIFDQRALFEAELKSSLVLDALATRDDTWRALQEMRTEVSIGMPTRSLSALASLPYPVRNYLPDFEGEGTFFGTLVGSLRDPAILVRAQAFNLTANDKGRLDKDWVPPLTMDATATYDPARDLAQLGVNVGMARLPVTSDRLFDLVASVGVVVDLDKGVLNGDKTLEEAPWRGDARAEFYELRLHGLPALSDLQIAGLLSGHVELKNLNRNPSAEGALIVPALRVQDRYQRVLVKANVQERAADAPFSVGTAELEIFEIAGTERPTRTATPSAVVASDAQSERCRKDEQAEKCLAIGGTAAFSWAGLAIPTLREEEPGTLEVTAKKFGIGVFYPLVEGVMSKLDGVLDGSGSIEWGRLANTSNGLIRSADFTLTDGVAYIDQLGQELWGGKATLRADPVREAGLQDLHLEAVEAHGAAGRVHGFATATMRGLSLVGAVGSLGIDEGEELPLTIEGVPLGKARADIGFELAPSERGYDIDVDVKNAHFELPASSTKNVQSLDEPRNITVNQPEKPKPPPRAEDATQYKLMVSIADTEVTSSSLNLDLLTPVGRPIELLLSDRLHARGDVLLDDGAIVLNKKTFVIDEAIIRLRDEDTGNPEVNLTAHWDGSAGSRVFVTYVGLLKPVTEDKITFRSDPPRSESEILKLLVFGDNEATGAALAGDVIGGTVATSLANDLLASAFGGVLRDVLAVNVGTSAAGGYVGAKISLSDQFSFGGTFEQVTETQTTTAETRAGGCGDFYFDYKISRSWSLRGSGGYCDYEDQGLQEANENGISLGLDVLWQVRY